MKKLLILIAPILLCLNSIANATTSDFHDITGKVLDEKNEPVGFATVTLLSQSDSSLVKGEMTDENGFFSFEHISSGNYILNVSFLGYQNFSNNIALQQPINVGTISLVKDATSLDEVVVVATKPLIQHENDKLILNVESSSLGSTGNALDVLQRAPGVIVDNDGNIRLKGKQGVLVMIDGKETYLSPEQLTNQLRNMQADNISTVEVISNPGAKYEAAGSAGIINIVTKKNKKSGLNGGITAGVSKGQNWGTNESLNLNYRNNRVNLFGNYSYDLSDRERTLDIYRNITYNDVLSIIGEKSDLQFTSNNQNAKAGIDFFVNDKNTIGFIASGFLYPETDDNTTTATFSNASNDLQSSSTTTGLNNGHYKNMSFNLNYEGTFDTLGRGLKANVDYSYYDNSSDATYTTSYFDNYGNESASPYVEYNSNPATVDIKSLKIDYTHPVKKIGTFETGIKSSYVVTDNDLQVSTLENEVAIPDSSRSNHFKYTENINAAYLNFSHQWKKIGIQAGLRGEQTIADGNSLSLENTFHRNYFQLFPSFTINDQLNDNNSLSFSYSHRIDRPAYQQLDPFVYYLDQYLYEQGNPNLKPQLTHSFSLSYMFKQTYAITFDYSLTTDNIIELFYQVDSTSTTYVTPGNFDNVSYFDVNVYAPFNITKWWSVTPVVTVYYLTQNTDYLDEDFKSSKLSFNANVQNSFQFPKGFSAEVSGFYQSDGIWSVATFESFSMVSAGITKSFKDGKARLKLSVQDIFLDNFIEGTVRYANIDGGLIQTNDTRQANLTFTYNFGKQTQQREHTASDEEEKSRVKTGR